MHNRSSNNAWNRLLCIKLNYAERAARSSLTSALIVLAFMPPLCLADEVFQVQRARGQDATNIFYLFSKFHRKNTDTNEFFECSRSVSQSPDLRTMSEAFEKTGLSVAVSRVNIDELGKISYPACVLLNHEGSTIGKWHLLVYVASDHVSVVRGDSLIVDLMSISDFRSQWNGFAIMASDHPATSTMALRISSLFVSFGIFIYLSRNSS